MSPSFNHTNPQTVKTRESLLLAPYGMHTIDSRGRQFDEPEHAYRGAYQRDRDRIVHSAAYRRLSHKMQVFTGEMGDYHRTRLTHTLEVASVARTLSRTIRLNEDLTEALALAHDIGHPPFGHSGEDVLDEMLADFGGFNHNQHALRILESLETRYHQFDGLNLTQEVLSGQRYRVGKKSDETRPLLEVQTVDTADSIAYDAHDADDALELGLLKLDQLMQVPIWREAARRVKSRYANLTDAQLRSWVVHELIDWQVGDVIEHALVRIVDYKIESVADVIQAPLVIHPGKELAQQKGELESFLHRHVYRHPRVMEMRETAQKALCEMFDHFVAHPKDLPDGFRGRIDKCGLQQTVGDYLAGMTDRFAMARHEQIGECRSGLVGGESSE